MTPGREWLAFGLVLAAALALRVALILSPFGWLEADEAIVGLMADHILGGDRPVFYWGQSYLGALEAYCAAAVFALLGSSVFSLRLVPALFSVGFIGLNYLVGRRLFGPGPALASSLYLAVPPTMLAVWSIKPRGGYAELLFLGEAVLLLSLCLPASRRPRVWSAIWGLAVGVGLWTNQFAVVYVVPSAVYLALAMRWRALSLAGPALAGCLVGAAPLIFENLRTGFASVGSLNTSAGAGLSDVPRNVRTLARMGLPVLVGLGQPTADLDLWQADWPGRPAGNPLVALAADLALLAGLLAFWPSIWALVRGKNAEAGGPALLVGLAVATLVALPFTKFAELIAEPRYALPLYATAPLYAALAWRLTDRRWLLAALALPVALNVHNLATADPWLLLPTTAGKSTPETRAELAEFLARRGLTRIYADYWVVYPLVFESRERIVGGVATNGFNRFPPYAHLAYVEPRPAFVLVAGSPEAEAFYARMAALGARGSVERVAIYDVVYDVEPLEPLRP